MNIFVLDKDPREAARMLCDKHVPKMIVESGQMLSTAHRMLDGTPIKRPSKSGKTIQTYYTFDDERDNLYYLAVHKYHPCTTWTMHSKANYEWHYEHFHEMALEYQYRRNGKMHETFRKIGILLVKPPLNIKDRGLTEFAQAMSHYPQCKDPDPVTAYRNYYHQAKPFAKWEWKRKAPDWWQGYQGVA